MKKYKFKIVLFIILAALVYVYYDSFSNYDGDTVSVNGHVFKVDVVETSEELERGLSGRESIAEDQAMLFIFPDKDKRVFWMKDMNFNIDLLWIDDNTIVAYEKNMLAPDKDAPVDNLKRYVSDQEVDKVLEIKAGLIDSFNIQIGDVININI